VHASYSLPMKKDIMVRKYNHRISDTKRNTWFESPARASSIYEGAL